MRKLPAIYRLDDLRNAIDGDTLAHIGTAWVAARPMSAGGWRVRFKAAWLAFTGKADVVIWPGDQ